MSIVFVAMLDEGSKRVHKEEEKEAEDKKFFHADIESSNANVPIRLINLKVSLGLKIILLAKRTKG